MMIQRHQALYTNYLEGQNVGVIQCARAQHPFQYPSEYQLAIDIELPGVIWGLYGIWGDTRSPKV